MIKPTHLLLALALAPSARSQAAKPAFEVAAIKRSAPDPTHFGYDLSSSGEIHFMAMTAESLVSMAYSAKQGTVFGTPHWAQTERFDIDARIDEPLARQINALPPLQRRAQLASLVAELLEERFHLKVHRETREFPIYALVLAKGPIKLHPSPPLPPLPGETQPRPEQGGSLLLSAGQWTVKRMSMAGWASNLGVQPEIDRIVVDETGLKGPYDFNFKWSEGQDEATTIFTALEEQLGLKLVPKKAPVETCVIDHIE